MALVFRGRDRTNGDAVALKIIRPQLTGDPHALALFRREAEVSAKLTHRNIVRVRDVVPLAHDGCAMVMDFIAGTSLKQHLRSRGALAFDRAIAVLADVASALEYAHFAGLVHRDVKPENIFLEQRSGRALVADFGIAHAIGVPITDPSDSTHGTPSYMSPEHIDGRPMDGRSDIYSLGCVAFELLTGSPPWAGLTVGEILERQRNQRIPPIHTSRQDIPAWLEEVVARAVAKRPEDRWPDMKAFAAALTRSAASSAPPVPSGQVIGTTLPLQTVGGIAVAVIGAVVLFVSGMGDSADPAESPTVGATVIDPRVPLQGGQSELLANQAEPAVPAAEMAPLPPGPAAAYPDSSMAPLTYDGDGDAESALRSARRAQQLDENEGTDTRFQYINMLETFSQQSNVSPQIRSALARKASELRIQCQAMPGAICG